MLISTTNRLKPCVCPSNEVDLETLAPETPVQLLQGAPNVIVYQISVKPFRFDDARNAALALLPVDVDMCLSLDLDEIPQDGFFDVVRQNWTPDVNRIWVTWETGYKWQNNNRLHSRHGYRWVKPCHEVTEYYGDFFGGEEKSITPSRNYSFRSNGYVKRLILSH